MLHLPVIVTKWPEGMQFFLRKKGKNLKPPCKTGKNVG